MDIDAEKLGNTVRTIRRAHGLKQRELAKMAGISPSYLSLLENGKRGFAVEHLSDVAKCLNTEAYILTFLATPPHKSNDELENRLMTSIREMAEDYFARVAAFDR